MPRNYKSKETVLVITVGFLCIHIFSHVKLFLYISLFIGLAGIFSFYLSEKIDLFWNMLSLVMGKVSNFVLLTVVYFLVVMPVSFLRRLHKKNSLNFFDKGKTSNFNSRDHTFEKKDLENTW
ncbi:MAG TPA: hypothetical protein VL727_23640 [Puia sp.]|nr:hypothetical protein [Puia sp.]